MDNFDALNPCPTFVRTLRRLLSRRLLAAKIDLFHQPALIHERNAISLHSEVYRLLYQEALSHARAYADTWGVPIAELHACIPALEHLRFLAGTDLLLEKSLFRASH